MPVSQGPLVQIERASESTELSVERPAPVSPESLKALKEELSTRTGRQYWRSLEELADSRSFRELIHREFPENASEWTDPRGRRKFLKLMGASLALAGLTGCTRQPTEYIAPYVRQPEEIIPGKPLFFATSMTLGGFARGVLVESHEGRPTKIEGNPDHPASLGSLDVFGQASILDLYDPDRSQTVTYIEDEKPWSAFLGAIRPAITAQRALNGAGLRILTGNITSPTLLDQLRQLLTQMPLAKWHVYEPAGNANAREGSRLAFNEYVHTYYRFDKADVILSLDSDFLVNGPGSLRYARDFIAKRTLNEDYEFEMCRLYTVESTLTSTGAKSDHRLPLKPTQIEAFGRSVASALGIPGMTATSGNSFDALANAVAADLKVFRGRSIVIPGESQSPAVHALAHLLNDFLGNVGTTVIRTSPIDAPQEVSTLPDLVRDLESGQVNLLIILGTNPVYSAPADLNFAQAMTKAPLRVHLSPYQDETSELCQWHVPESHYLESWSDACSFDGTWSIIQPLIAPLYRSRTAHELIAALSDRPERSSYDIVREYWRTKLTGDFDKAWRRALHDGLVVLPPPAPKQVTANASAVQSMPQASSSDLEISFRVDPTIYDGRFANNGWLQELPKPISTLTWDNAAIVSPATARSLGLGVSPGRRGGDFQSDQINLEYEGRSVKAAVWIMPGQPDGTITVHLGYGRTRAGRIGGNRHGSPGFNGYAIRTSAAPWFGTEVRVTKTGVRGELAALQLHHALDVDDLQRRDLIRAGTLEHYKQHPDLRHDEHHAGHEPASFFPVFEYTGYAWGMAIDLHACIGCNACVVACQSENNIPIVGKEQVLRSREMHWLRVDSYFTGGDANPETYFQPVPCMQCESAPCEVVCPVAATAHSAEGLNDMVYNRCVGTRYCSNNCPYKVRRFNFLLYQDFETPSLKMMRNPDVSVRSRGVMEKCTYCVQRINRVKIESQKEDRDIRDGEIQPACAQTCPTQAIVFGDINNKESKVAKLKAEQRSYGLLPELNTKPRTTYLGAVRNVNPEVKA